MFLSKFKTEYHYRQLISIIHI